MDRLTHFVSYLDLDSGGQAIVDSQDNRNGVFCNVRSECQSTEVQTQDALDALTRVLTYLEDEPRGLGCLSKAEMSVLRRIEARMRKRTETLETIGMLPGPAGAD